MPMFKEAPMERQQTLLGLVGYLFIGTAAVLIPSVMPAITAEFGAAGLTLAAIGLIFPARALGGILGNVLAGIGSDLLGRPRLVWLAALLLAGALGLTAASRPWLLLLLGFLLANGAQGALSTGINAMIADANLQAQARALNILHGVYGGGAALSPLAIGYLLDQGLSWRWSLAGTGLIWLIYAVSAYGLYRAAKPEARSAASQKLDLGMLRQRSFVALFLIAFIYNGVAYSLLGWIALMAQEQGNPSALFAVSFISLFYLALTAGRFLCAAFAERLGYITTLALLAAGMALTYPLVFLNLGTLWMATGVFCSGLSLSGLFPTALAYGSRLYPAQTGTMTGTLNVAMTLGAMVPPLWTGVVAQQAGFPVALGLNYLLVLPLGFLVWDLARQQRAGGASRPPVTQA
uniref:MFS transporter n=2 Tax=Litorilinea aerophila TaxID=1204385 RepID=A0A540VLI5_9CHLR